MNTTRSNYKYDQEQAELFQTVLSTRREKLHHQFKKLASQKAFIRQEKRKLVLQKALLDSEQQRYQASLESDWFCSAAFTSSNDRKIALYVGNQRFEITSTIALKDSKSLLAALLSSNSPLQVPEIGSFAIDREWTLFRLVLNFLRDGVLPNDPVTLRKMYLEADFYKLDTLKQAIEQRKLNAKNISKKPSTIAITPTQVIETAKPLNNSTQSDKQYKLEKPWWETPPPWWGKLQTKKEEAKKEEKITITTWWDSSKYKGNDYMKFLSEDLQRLNALNEDKEPTKASNTTTSVSVQDKNNATSSSSAKKYPDYPLLRSTWQEKRDAMYETHY